MKTALLVIDYINGIIDGSCREYSNKHPIVKNTNKLITEARNKSIPIYFIRLAFDSNYSNIPKHSQSFNHIKSNGLFQLGSESTEFIKDLDYQENDCVFNKTAASPFHSKDLIKVLNSQGIERLVFSGVSTDNAINLGVREASDAGFYTIIAEDACGASSEEFHLWSIKMLKKITNEIISINKTANIFMKQ